jgi:FtsP/CotA-like multicopper oxidase with cupredoxin domain
MKRLPVDLRRRAFLRAGAAGVLVATPAFVRADSAAATLLRAAPARLSLLGPGNPDTDVWAYNGRVPGPLLRVKQGERVDAILVNDLAEPTTVHWHGLRLPNAMDGVPHVTQPPIEPGGRFRYAFACPDAGTFWYHPHARSNVQVEMGLHGVLIVDEPSPPPVDRDLVWVLDDWRMARDGQVVRDFSSRFDATHAGRIGNTVTIDGRLPDRFALRAGERIRLRLVNVANARIVSLRFEGHAPVVIAFDGMPCEPHRPERDRIVLGPGMRADLIVDATGDPGATFRVIDDFFVRDAYELVTLAYDTGRRIRDKPLAMPSRLAANPVAAPRLGTATRHRITLSGGMMGGSGPMMMNASAHAWALNGRTVDESAHAHEPLLTLRHGDSHVFEIVNDTAWWHPMHVHGHAFEIVSRNGERLPRPIFADTALIPPRERVEVALVADNPGDWMFHCHVLEHQASGMMATLRVA